MQDSGSKLQFRVTPAAVSGKSPGAAVLSPEITIENSAPSITGLVISGSVNGQAYTGLPLQASYSFHDLDGDGEDGSTYQWLYDGTPPTAIGGVAATAQTYTVANADMGKVILVRVTPKDSKNNVGAIYTSPAVTVVNKAPVASNVRVNQTENVLRVTYDYTDQEGDPEAGSPIRWLRNGAEITGATNLEYTLTFEDAGKTITAEVTPRAGKGTSPGLPVMSNAVKVASLTAVLTVSAGLKQLHFSWYPVTKATYYRVLYNPDGASGFVLLSPASDNLSTTSYDWDISVHRINWPKAQFMLEACDASVCAPSASIDALNVMLDAIGYFKASNVGTFDFFGTSVALSDDGHTLAVGAHNEDSAGVGGKPVDDCATTTPPATNCARDSGAVYVYTRSSTSWSQQAYVKASNSGAYDHFGRSLALSGDGLMLAVGAPYEASATTGVIPGTPGEADTGNAAPNSGAVYVYTRSGTSWSQQAYVKASNSGAGDWFGYSVALSGDGLTLAVGAHNEDSPGVGGNPVDDCATTTPPATNCASNSGAVYVYTRSGTSWSQQAYVKASNSGANDLFGVSVALSRDGITLAVGAYGEASDKTGVIPSASNEAATGNAAPDSGAVYVYTRSGTSWLQQAYVKASNTGARDWFGSSVALSDDGLTLVVGAYGEASATTVVIPGAPNEADTPNATVGANFGAVYVYTRSGTSWSQQAYVKASNSGANDLFGVSVALSGDGLTLAVGASGEASAATGVNNTAPGRGDNTAPNAGAVYLY